MADDGDSPSACFLKHEQRFGLPQTPCVCNKCNKITDAIRILLNLFRQRQDDAEGVVFVQPLRAVSSAASKLHHLHRPEDYNHDAQCHLIDRTHENASDASEQAADDGDSEQNSDPGGEAPLRGYATRSRETQKFMVCDHCRGHGLPCEEAAICAQCRLSKTACIHRICRQSPSNRNNCPDPGCRYLHTDYLPTSADIPPSSYIFLPGDLRGYCYDGKREAFGWLDEARDKEFRGYQHYVDLARARQEQTRQEINAELSRGMTALADFRGTCGDRCRLEQDASPEPSGVHAWSNDNDNGDITKDGVESTTEGALLGSSVCEGNKDGPDERADSLSIERTKPVQHARCDCWDDDCAHKTEDNKQDHHSSEEREEVAASEDDSLANPVCSLCKLEPSLYCIFPCNHWMCQNCTIARRALLSDLTCSCCGDAYNTFIVTENPSNRWEDLEILDQFLSCKRLPQIGAQFQDPALLPQFDACVAKMFKCPWGQLQQSVHPKPKEPRFALGHHAWQTILQSLLTTRDMGHLLRAEVLQPRT